MPKIRRDCVWSTICQYRNIEAIKLENTSSKTTFRLFCRHKTTCRKSRIQVNKRWVCIWRKGRNIEKLDDVVPWYFWFCKKKGTVSENPTHPAFHTSSEDITTKIIVWMISKPHQSWRLFYMPELRRCDIMKQIEIFILCERIKKQLRIIRRIIQKPFSISLSYTRVPFVNLYNSTSFFLWRLS